MARPVLPVSWVLALWFSCNRGGDLGLNGPEMRPNESQKESKDFNVHRTEYSVQLQSIRQYDPSHCTVHVTCIMQTPLHNDK